MIVWQDVLIYCVAGEKRFLVAGTEAGSPPTVDALLRPGDAVFVPALHYHFAMGGSSSSCILSFSLEPAIATDVWEAAEARDLAS